MGNKAPRPISKRTLARLVYTSGINGLHLFQTGGFGGMAITVPTSDYATSCALVRALRAHVSGLPPEQQRAGFASWMLERAERP